MKFSNYAKALLLIGLSTWSLCELDVFNLPLQLAEKNKVFDYDFGDHKLHKDQYKIIVDWGKTEYIYGNGDKLIQLKRVKYNTFDLSWVPFFKHYKTEGEWRVEGFPIEREHIEANYSVKKFGFVSRKDVLTHAQEKVSKKILKAFSEQSFYDDPMQDVQIKLGVDFDKLRSKCFPKSTISNANIIVIGK